MRDDRSLLNSGYETRSCSVCTQSTANSNNHEQAERGLPLQQTSGKPLTTVVLHPATVNSPVRTLRRLSGEILTKSKFMTIGAYYCYEFRVRKELARQMKKDKEVKRGSVSLLIGGVAIFLTMVEYRAYIDNTKRFFYHVHSQKSIRRYPGQVQFQSLFHQPFLPIHRFPGRFLLRLPLRFLSPVPCPAITGHPSESCYSIPSRYIRSSS